MVTSYFLIRDLIDLVYLKRYSTYSFINFLDSRPLCLLFKNVNMSRLSMCKIKDMKYALYSPYTQREAYYNRNCSFYIMSNLITLLYKY